MKVDERFIGNDGPGFQCHIAGELWDISITGRGAVLNVSGTNVKNNFPRGICENRDARLQEGFSGGERKSANDSKNAYRSNFGPVIEHLPDIFKILGLVSLRDVDRLGASDMDIVGMQEVRKGWDAFLCIRPSHVADEFDLLFGHWYEADERLE